MKNYRLAFLAFLAVLCLLSSAHAQKKVLAYPFQFEKSFLAKGQYSTYFLDNPADSSFAIILKDNEKAEYVLLNRNFKPKSKISSPIGNTILSHGYKYVGGTARGVEDHFIYQYGSEFFMETVDFNSHALNNKKIFELPRSEKPVASFSNDNVYYCMAADDKAGRLVKRFTALTSAMMRH